MIKHIVPLIFHGAVAAIDIWVIHWVITHLGWGVLIAMLTMWGQVLHAAYFTWAFVQDLLIGFPKGKRNYAALTERLYSLAFVLATVVGVLFWAIFIIDKELIMPGHVEEFYPWYINLYQHGLTAVLVWLELFVRDHKNLSPRADIVTAFTFGIVYLAWNGYLGYVSEFPYPFQKELGLAGNLVFDVGCFFMLYGLIVLKRRCISWVHLERVAPQVAAGLDVPARVTRSAVAKAQKVL